MKQRQFARRRQVGMLAVVILMALPIIGIAQKQNYSWMELPKKDAERVLTNSPWSQTQVDTDVSEQFFSPTRPGAAAVGQSTPGRGTVTGQQSINNNRADRGAVNEAVRISYRISFLSSRPVRQALANGSISAEREPNDQLVKSLQDFVERDFSQYIAIAVPVSSTDGRFSGPALQAINSATTGTLKNKAYVERQDAKRLVIQ